MSAEAYPLYWPEGWPRAKRRQQAKYQTLFGRARDHLLHELRLMGATSVVLSSNVPLRRDGLPYADFARARIDDPGVAVYFVRGSLKGGQQQVIACDKWDNVTDNMRAVGLTIEALRGIARAGATELLDRAFTGFKALPPAGGTTVGETGAPWWQVLGVSESAPVEAVKAAYRALAAKHHPDAGGDHGAMAAINRAYEQAQGVGR